MDLSTLSKRYGIYLAKVNACFKSVNNIVITDFMTINDYNLHPGSFVKIMKLDDNKTKDEFIVMPYIKSYKDNYGLIERILRDESLSNKIFIDDLRKVGSSFYFARNDPKGFRLTHAVNPDKAEFEIALPEKWLDSNNIELGAVVLLGNNVPGPKIF